MTAASLQQHPPPATVQTDEHHNQDIGEDAVYQGIDIATLSIDISPFEIPRINATETQLQNVTWTENRKNFTISTSSPITAVDWYMLPDGRLVVDVINAINASEQNSHDISSGSIYAVRLGQNVINNENVARVVFDITAPTIYSVRISDDRRQITVSFEENHISSVVHTVEGLSDTLIITGTIAPYVQASPRHLPNQLIIDLPWSTIANDINVPIVNGGHVTGIHLSQVDSDNSRITVDLHSHRVFSVTHVGNATIINLFEPTYRNILFNAATETLEIKRPRDGFSATQIQSADNYLNLCYEITLSGDFSDFFGFGDFVVNYGSLSKIVINTTNGRTTMTINTNRIMAFIITESTDSIYIRPVHPREKYPRIVFIDPGHGGTDPEAVHHGMRESDLNLQISELVIQMLLEDGLVRPYSARHSDISVSLATRTAQANDLADIFVSIHNNAAANVAAHGTETLYWVHPDEPTNFNSRDMAEIFQRNLVETLNSND